MKPAAMEIMRKTVKPSVIPVTIGFPWVSGSAVFGKGSVNKPTICSRKMKATMEPTAMAINDLKMRQRSSSR